MYYQYDQMSLLGRIVYGLLFALWLGGLAFYAVVVIPIGVARWGAHQQGLLTAAVAIRLNWIAVASIACAVVDAVRRRERWIFAAAFLLAIAQVILFALHDRMTQLLSTGADGLADGGFNDAHLLYLVISTVQWFVGLALFLRLLVSPGFAASGSPPQR